MPATVTAAMIAAVPTAPTEGEPFVIARSAPQERADGSGEWWKEWRLRYLRGAYPFAAVLETRYYGPGSAKIENGHNWTLFHGDDSFRACVWEAIGDTSFEKAESLEPIHQDAVRLVVELREARHVLASVQERLERACGNVSERMDRANKEYAAKLERVTDTTKHPGIAKRMLEKHSPGIEAAKREREEIRGLVTDAADRVSKALAAVERWQKGGKA